MTTYRVKWTETETWEMEVEAESVEAAQQRAVDLINDGDAFMSARETGSWPSEPVVVASSESEQS